MLHAIQAPERVTPPAPARIRPPVPTTPAVEGTTTPGTTPTTPTTVAVPEAEPGPTFREFFFNHPGIRCMSSPNLGIVKANLQ